MKHTTKKFRFSKSNALVGFGGIALIYLWQKILADQLANMLPGPEWSFFCRIGLLIVLFFSMSVIQKDVEMAQQRQRKPDGSHERI